MKNHAIVVLGVCLLLLIGCGENVQVSGKVTFEDGTPLSKGTVIFTTGTNQSKAAIETDGSYRIGTLNPGDGVPRGTYQVYITGTIELHGAGPMGMPLGATQLVDSKFTSPETSGLTCEVKGSRTYDITVTPPKK